MLTADNFNLRMFGLGFITFCVIWQTWRLIRMMNTREKELEDHVDKKSYKHNCLDFLFQVAWTVLGYTLMWIMIYDSFIGIPK